MEHYSAMKKDKIMPLAWQQGKDLDIVILGKMSGRKEISFDITYM